MYRQLVDIQKPDGGWDWPNDFPVEFEDEGYADFQYAIGRKRIVRVYELLDANGQTVLNYNRDICGADWINNIIQFVFSSERSSGNNHYISGNLVWSPVPWTLYTGVYTIRLELIYTMVTDTVEGEQVRNFFTPKSTAFVDSSFSSKPLINYYFGSDWFDHRYVTVTKTYSFDGTSLVKATEDYTPPHAEVDDLYGFGFLYWDAADYFKIDPLLKDYFDPSSVEVRKFEIIAKRDDGTVITSNIIRYASLSDLYLPVSEYQLSSNITAIPEGSRIWYIVFNNLFPEQSLRRFTYTININYKYREPRTSGLGIEYNYAPNNQVDAWASLGWSRPFDDNYLINNDTPDTFYSGYKPSFYRIFNIPSLREPGRYLLGVTNDYLTIYSATESWERGVAKYSIHKSSFKDGIIPKRLLLIIQGAGSSGNRNWSSYAGGAGGGSGATAAVVIDIEDGKSGTYGILPWHLYVGKGGKYNANISIYGQDGEATYIIRTVSVPGGDGGDVFMCGIEAGGGRISGFESQGVGGIITKHSLNNYCWELNSQAGVAGGHASYGSNAATNGVSNQFIAYSTFISEDRYGTNVFFEKHTGGKAAAKGGGGGASPFANGGFGLDGYVAESGSLGSGGGGQGVHSSDSGPLSAGDGGDGVIYICY